MIHKLLPSCFSGQQQSVSPWQQQSVSQPCQSVSHVHSILNAVKRNINFTAYKNVLINNYSASFISITPISLPSRIVFLLFVLRLNTLKVLSRYMQQCTHKCTHTSNTYCTFHQQTSFFNLVSLNALI